jgi:hypothetical protein
MTDNDRVMMNMDGAVIKYNNDDIVMHVKSPLDMLCCLSYVM